MKTLGRRGEEWNDYVAMGALLNASYGLVIAVRNLEWEETVETAMT